MRAVQEIQESIIEEFKTLADNRESVIIYIMELGQRLPKMDDTLKTKKHIIEGCQSKVWLVADYINGKIKFLGDSNTDITKGLISLLIRVLSNQTPETILNTELVFIEKIGMKQIIGSQRSNGFSSMIKQMKLYAIAYQIKMENK